MVYLINYGHCLNGADSGAEGCGKREQDLTRLVGGLVTSKLKAKGHTVIVCTIDSANSVRESLNAISAKANGFNADFFISIHFNASDTLGHGVEVYTYNAKEIKQARDILNNIAKLGYANRGIKDGSKLAVIHNTKACAMLVECCFIDNKGDMALFNVEKTANAIVDGLTGSSSLIKKPAYQERYVREFQTFYNAVTKTSTPITVNGVYGDSTEKAYQLLNKLIKGEY